MILLSLGLVYGITICTKCIYVYIDIPKGLKNRHPKPKPD